MSPEKTQQHRWLIVLVLVAAVGLGGAMWQAVVGQEASTAVDPAAVAKAQSLSEAFRAAAQKVMPTVVKITSTTNPRVVQNGQGPAMRNPFAGTPFEDLFGDDFPGFQYQYRTPSQRGLGSGVIVDPSGIILTNRHVIDGADKVVVELADGTTHEAVQIASDEATDLAIVRIETDKPLPAARLGDSDKMQIGDWVLAIGNPFALDMTVSAGIISGKERSLRSNERASFLQTDAAINPGNSGGPLVSLTGEVVGINTAIASSTGSYQGVGFAIPSSLAKRVADELVKNGKVERAYLGVGITDTNSELGRRLGVDQFHGVVVAQVTSDSPAEAAGMQVGDVIQKFADRAVAHPHELQEIVEQSPARSSQKVRIVRDGQPKTLDVVIQPLPDNLAAPSALSGGGQEGPSESPGRELGLDVGELTPQAAAELGLAGATGVLITGVQPQGVAAMAGIDSGMVIVEVDRKPVASVKDFAAALKNKSLADGLLLKIRTKDASQLVLLQDS